MEGVWPGSYGQGHLVHVQKGQAIRRGAVLSLWQHFSTDGTWSVVQMRHVASWGYQLPGSKTATWHYKQQQGVQMPWALVLAGQVPPRYHREWEAAMCSKNEPCSAASLSSSTQLRSGHVGHGSTRCPLRASHLCKGMKWRNQLPLAVVQGLSQGTTLSHQKAGAPAALCTAKSPPGGGRLCFRDVIAVTQWCHRNHFGAGAAEWAFFPSAGNPSRTTSAGQSSSKQFLHAWKGSPAHPEPLKDVCSIWPCKRK